MSRTVVKIKSNDIKKDNEIILEQLAREDYELKEKNGEQFYQNGVGLIVAPKFIKYYIEGDIITLEAWVRNFAFGGESSLDGFVGSLPKKQVKDLLNIIQLSVSGDVIETYKK